MKSLSRVLLIISLAVCVTPAEAQNCVGGSIACGEQKNGTLDFENDACLDSDTLRYHIWPVELTQGNTINVQVTSGFFAPRMKIIRPDNTIAYVGSNPNELYFVQANGVPVTSSGTWFIQVGNLDVGAGGPYTLQLGCNTPPPPPPPPPPPLTASASPSTFRVTAGDVVTTTVRTKVRDGFASSVSLQPVDVPSGVSVTVEPSTIPHPGEGEAHATITVGALANGIYNFGITASGGGREFVAPLSLIIQTSCDPPFLLSNQPRGQTVYVGGRATLVVDPSGTAPMKFQWYRGHSGQTFGKIDGSTSPTYVTDPLYEDQSYWVQIRNGCGTRESITATVEVEPTPPRRRAVRRH